MAACFWRRRVDAGLIALGKSLVASKLKEAAN
jgi:hypothetical protein